MSTRSPSADLTIVRLDPAAHANACAEMMSSSEPWLTLGRTREKALELLTRRDRESYVALRDGRLAGFLVLCMQGAFVGYIQTVCVAADSRGQGIGSRLIEFAEKRILSETPNVFMCVSSFNTEAKRLYLRMGYQVVGELRDYIIAGHSEILLRKTIGPLGRAPARG
ncbi:MAG TPA: N-acetyltransferase [Myxococcaceae bacterium]|nr:N-acetyltransferase [Myxococcaceae bacterium]